MNNGELKKYLNSFPDDVEVSVIIANIQNRKYYPLTEYHGITDMGQPVFLLGIEEAENMDEEDRNHTDLQGQMVTI